MVGSLSGPIIHDRTFFMMAFEHLKDVQPEASTYTVPTEKMRRGDLSEFSGLIYDPLTASGSANTRKAFTGNIIDQELSLPLPVAESPRHQLQLLHQPVAAV